MEKRDCAGRGHQSIFGFGVAVRGSGSGGCLDGRLVPFMARGQIVFERVHVWWEAGNLTEDDGEVERYQKGHQMEAAINHAGEKC